MADGGIPGWPIASFFKLILRPRLDLHKLAIPSAFMESHGDDISNVIYLNIPPGKVWKFNLVRENGKTLLQNGWPEFVEFYSLNHGHLLVFKYEGNSRFNVVICDTSASEIEYPLGPQACTTEMKTSPSLAKPASSSKKAKELEMVMDDDKLIIAKTNRGISCITPIEDKRVRAIACQLKHPSFVAKIRASFVNRSHCYMGVPKEFAKRYLHKKVQFESVFRFQTDDNNNRKIWEINIVGEDPHVRMKRGWRGFVSENRLKLGDICIFELLSKEDIKVHILRRSAIKSEFDGIRSHGLS